MTTTSQAILFTGASGETLAARLEMPAGPPVAYALFAHCFTCSKDTKATAFIAGALADAGIAVLRFDFTGLGNSDGEFANTNFSSNIEDLLAAADFLRSEHQAPRLLIGHSLGGAAVIAAAARIPESVAVATINAPADPAHVLAHIGHARDEIEREGEAEVELGGRRFRIQKQFLEDVSQARLKPMLADLGRALIVFHAPRDTTVGIDNAAQLFTAAKHPKSFVSLDDADHLLSRKADARYVGAVLAAWAARYLDGDSGGKATAAESESESDPTQAEWLTVEETGQSRFRQRIQAGRHILTADEPPDVGGEDSGPSPYQLLTAALGACTTMTLRMYAEHKKLPLDKVSVRLRHGKIHAKDCETCETRDGKIDRIEREITLTGDLDAEQRQRLLEIADRCPVHRTLHSEVQVTSRLTADD